MDKRGNWKIRKTLYMPTVVAVRYNPVIKTFYSKLCARGKPKMVALIAAIRKPLLIARAVLINKKTFKINQKNLT